MKLFLNYQNAIMWLILLTVLTSASIKAQETDKSKIKIVGVEVITPTIEEYDQQQKKARRTPTPKPTPTPTQVPTSQTRGYIKKNVVLAVGQATRFKCPETPIQLILGNNSGFKVVESVGESSNDFYLLPKQGGFSTNMFVEFSNSTTEVKLTIIDPKKNALYDTEVALEAPNNPNRSPQNTAMVNDLKKQLTDSQSALTEEKKISAQLKRQLDEERNRQPDMQSLLFGLYDRRNSWDAKTMNLGNLRVNVIGYPVMVSPGNYVLMVEYVNRDKKKPARIVEPVVDGFEGNVKGQFDVELKPDESKRMVIEITATKLAGGVPRIKFQLEKNAEFFSLGQIQIVPQS